MHQAGNLLKLKRMYKAWSLKKKKLCCKYACVYCSKIIEQVCRLLERSSSRFSSASSSVVISFPFKNITSKFVNLRYCLQGLKNWCVFDNNEQVTSCGNASTFHSEDACFQFRRRYRLSCVSSAVLLSSFVTSFNFIYSSLKFYVIEMFGAVE